MTTIYPCRLCPLREGCEHRDELRSRAAGLGARAVTFDCDRLRAELRRGRRIMVQMPRADVGADYDGEPWVRIRKVAVPATITGTSGYYEFSCVTDPGTATALNADFEPLGPDDPTVQRYRFRRSQKHHRIVTFLEEPDRKLCDQGRPMLPDGTCDRMPGEPCGCRDFAELETWR